MIEPRIYCVYVHENLINGKVYVGMTSCPEFRFASNGNAYKRRKNGEISEFGKAIQEFGWSSFSHEIIWDDLTLTEARRMEKFLISYYNSTNPTKGYNRSKGGAGYTEQFISGLVNS